MRRIVCSMVRSGSKPPVCRTAPTWEWAIARRGEAPQTLTVPDVGVVSPRMRSMRVDLPAPLGPSRPMISPGAMVSETSSKAVRARALDLRAVEVRAVEDRVGKVLVMPERVAMDDAESRVGKGGVLAGVSAGC